MAGDSETGVMVMKMDAGLDTGDVALAARVHISDMITEADLRHVLAGPGVEITGRPGSEQLSVVGLSARSIGMKAAEHGIAVFELTPKTVSLEEAFMELTKDEIEYHATQTPGRAA